MCTGVGITWVVRLAAATAVTALIAMHACHAAPAYIGETGRPPNLINRPACLSNGASEDWFDCRPIEWPEAKNRSWHRPRP
jgi:hypothetical protein